MNEITAQRLRRIIDEGPSVPERAADHEVAPYVPPSEKTDGEMIADKSIGIVDKAASLVLAKYQELKDQIAESEQMVLNSQVEVRETIRNHMKIVETAMKVQQQIAVQITEANKLLRGNGHG